MLINTRGLQRGASRLLDLPGVLRSAAYGCESGRILRVDIPGLQGVTQEDPLSRTIFNMVVDVVMRHWVEVMVEVVGIQGKCGQEGRHQNSLF